MVASQRFVKPQPGRSILAHCARRTGSVALFGRLPLDGLQVGRERELPKVRLALLWLL